jgi:hypothetical protein
VVHLVVLRAGLPRAAIVLRMEGMLHIRGTGAPGRRGQQACEREDRQEQPKPPGHRNTPQVRNLLQCRNFGKVFLAGGAGDEKRRKPAMRPIEVRMGGAWNGRFRITTRRSRQDSRWRIWVRRENFGVWRRAVHDGRRQMVHFGPNFVGHGDRWLLPLGSRRGCGFHEISKQRIK